MEQLSRGQRMAVTAVALVLAVVFVILIVYFSAFSVRHPRIKHDFLFVVLTVGSLLVAWFAWPNANQTER